MKKNVISKHLDWNEERFEKSDPVSRKKTIEHFSTLGWNFVDNQDKFKIDLVSNNTPVLVKIELEHRLSWRGIHFPFTDANFPVRKCKYFGAETPNVITPSELFDMNPLNYYMILNERFTHFGIIHGNIIREIVRTTEAVEIPNRFVKEGEYFYKLPVKFFSWGELKK